MKRTLLKITLFVLTGVQIIPAQAMWTSAARAALRSGQFNASTRLAPAAIAGSNLLHSQPGTRLLARTLASKHSQDYSGYNRDEQKAGSNSNSSESNGYDWKSFFARVDKAQIFGASILGWHLWWSDSDICQTPEDFNDNEKTSKTINFYASGRINTNNFLFLADHFKGEIIIRKSLNQNCSSIKTVAPAALNNFVQFVHKKYSNHIIKAIIERDQSYIEKFALAAAENFSEIISAQKGLQILDHIFDIDPTTTAGFIPLSLDNFVDIIDHRGAGIISKIIKAQPQTVTSFLPLILKHFPDIAQQQNGCELIATAIKHNPQVAPFFLQPALDNLKPLLISHKNKALIAIIKHHPESILSITTTMIETIEFIKKGERNGMGPSKELLQEIAQYIPQNIEAFKELVFDNFSKIATSRFGQMLIEKITQLDPSTLDTFCKLTADTFTELAGKELGRKHIEKMLNAQITEKSAVLLFQAAVNSFSKLAQDNHGKQLLTKIINKNPKFTALFIQPAIDNFSTLCAEVNGFRILSLLLKYQPSSAVSFIQPALDNFATLAYNDYCSLFIVKIITAQPATAVSFIQPALDNFVTLANNYYGVQFIIKIIESQPSTAASFAQKTLENFAALADYRYGQQFIIKIIESQPATTASFAQLALDNFAALADNPYGLQCIIKIIEAQPATAASFIQLALDNFAKIAKKDFGADFILTIMLRHPEAVTSFEALAKSSDCLAIIARFKLQKTMTELFQSESSTQTTQHALALLAHNLNKIETFFPKDAKNIIAFKDMINKILTTERVEQESGNYTFVHAYPWNIRFLQDIDAQLRAIVYNIPLQQLSLRFIKGPHEATGHKPETVRKDILTNGPTQYYARDGNKQKHMIFMNYALLTNQHGSNTLQYIANDRCENPPKLLLDKVFKHLHLEQYHTKYQQEFKELEKLHREASMFGAGILFSFTPEMLEKSVYVCYGGGKKRKVYIKGIGKTDDVKLILDTLRTAPEKIKDLDSLEFVFVVTKDCALNPRVQEADAYKVIPFNAADPEKMALYEQKRDELMAKIKADIEAERAAKTPDELTADNKKIAGMMTWYASHSCLQECKESRIQENV